MSDRDYFPAQNQGIEYIDYPVSCSPTGGANPVGDPNSTGWGTWTHGITGPYGVMTGATGSTGLYAFTTKDPFVSGFVKTLALEFATPQAGAWTWEFGPVIKNKDNTLTVTIYSYKSGVATDSPYALNAQTLTTNRICLHLVLNNSGAGG